MENPLSRRVLDLFNGVYELLLLLMARLYGYTDEDADGIVALAYTMFPLMTQILRPIAELLTTLPFGDDADPRRAGPGFELLGAPPILPHRSSAHTVMFEKFEVLSADALDLGKADQRLVRLSSIGANLNIMGHKFAGVADGTYPPQLLVPGIVLPYQPPAT